MRRMIDFIKTEFAKRTKYFEEGAAENAEGNIRLLLVANIASLLLLVLLILITPFIIKGWTPSIYHIGFIPASAFCCVVTYLYNSFRTVKKSGEVTAMCVLFEVILFSFVILIDTAGTPSAPGSFMPIMCMVIPSLFIVLFYVSYGIIGAAEIGYIAAEISFKDPEIGQYDIFASIAALACSVIGINMIMFLRVRDFEARMKYKQLSTRDSLTDILNKKTVLEAFQEYFKIHNPDVRCTVIIIDLDNFKKINDTKGHAAGDEVLQNTGWILLETFRSTDIIGRFGGDEFMVLMKDVASSKLMKKKFAMIQRRLKDLAWNREGVKVTGSAGAVLVEDQEVDFNIIFRQVDAALYEAKKNGKADCIIRKYDSEN